MKALILSLWLLAGTSQASDISLRIGESINIAGNTVSCTGVAPYQLSPCTRARATPKRELYNLARSMGVGNCFIFNNGAYYGVMDSSGKQISMSYECQGSDGEYCEAPVNGLIQLACELKKCGN
jgi:hypothetical protein